MTQIVLPSGLNVDFGDASQEEVEDALEAMREQDPSLFEEAQTEPQNIDDLLARSGYSEEGQPVEEAPAFEPSNPGEVTDSEFQFFLGRGDSATDKIKRIENTFGPDTAQQVGPDEYVLKLDNISPELKSQYGLPETGTIYANEPGFSRYDLAGFAGQEAAPLTASLGAGLIFSGVGLIPGMVLMAGAGAGGKAFDELIIEDRIEKMNTQSDDEVYGDIALTGAFYGAGELIGRGVFAAGRRLIKGPGAKADPARIDALVRGGMNYSAAAKIAREEAKTSLRRAVAEGARPTVSEASQKAIMGRMQSIYEGIFPNAKAANQNLKFVEDTLGRLGAGEIDDATAKLLLNDQAKAINAQVANAMKNANVDESVRLANQHLQKVLDNEFKVLLDLYNPKAALRTGWKDSANLSARLFEQDSSILYKKAEDILKGVVDDTGRSAATFSSETVKQAIKGLQANKAQAAVLGDSFETGLFRYVKDKDTFSLTELTNLKTALRSAGKDPNLMPGMDDAAIGKIVTSIDDTINQRLQGLASLRVPTRLDPSRTVGEAMGAPSSQQLFEQGLLAFDKAQKFHASGIQRFKSFAQMMLEKNIRSGVTLGDKEILNTVVEAGNPGKLLAYLKSVTPSGRAVEGIQSVPQGVFDDAARAANAGDFAKANQLLDDAGVPDEIVKRLPTFAERLPRGPNGQLDPFARMVGAEFAGTIRNLGKMAQARSDPLQFRNNMRDALAREWLTQNQGSSIIAGEFSPTVFASKFDMLGDGVQNSLFGKTNASALRQLMKDYHLVGMSNKSFANATSEALGSTASAIRARAMGLTGGRSVSDEVANVQSIMKEAERQSEDALFQAVKSGKLDDADAVVLNILKTPQNYDRLAREFGAQLDGPAGVKDMVMGRIMESAFPNGVTADAVASGAWGAPMRKRLAELNRNGALAKILGDGDPRAGQAVVDNLFKASKIGERISDTALKGKQGLASAAFAAGAGMRFLTNPLSFIGEAAGIFAMGRIMRQEWFLKSLLKPQYSAGAMGLTGGRRLLQEARKAGADVKGVSPLGLELRERIAQEARLVAAALAKDPMSSDNRAAVQDFVSENITQPTQAAVQGASQQLPVQAPVPVQAPQAAPQATAPSALAAGLRRQEMDKLLGITP